MKTKYPIALLMLGMSVAAVAQEDDDMYFNKKDRATVSEQTELAWAKRNQEEDINAVRTNPVNPSDSYSGRGVNPEYNAQTKNGTSVVQNEPDYFLPNYQPTNVNSNLYNGGTTASNNYYGNSAYNNSYNNGMGYGGFGSPYGYSPYSSMYSPYGYGYSPYGMGMGSYGMGGMGMGSYMGMGMGMGMGYGFGSYGSGMYGGMGMGYGSMYGYNPYGYGGYGYGYPSTIVVVGGDAGTRTVNGRYTSRSSNVNNNYVSTGRSTTVADGSTGRGGVSNGRVATSGTNNYYDRSWKNNTSTGVSRGSYDSNGGSRSGTTSWGSGSRGTWSGGNSNTGGSTGRSSGFDNSGSRSFGTGNSNFGGSNSGSRGSFGGGSSGGSSSGGGGGGSRGRN